MRIQHAPTGYPTLKNRITWCSEVSLARFVKHLPLSPCRRSKMLTDPTDSDHLPLPADGPHHLSAPFILKLLSLAAIPIRTLGAWLWREKTFRAFVHDGNGAKRADVFFPRPSGKPRAVLKSLVAC